MSPHGPHVSSPFRRIPDKTAPITRALDQSEQVEDKVKEAATDLSSVNAVLKDEVASSGTLRKVERALDKSEAVEAKVQEAATELAAVNDALEDEIEERHALEDRLLESDDALAASRVQESRSRHDALHDATTGLPNMALFNDRLGNTLAQAQRHTRPFAVMFIDVDEFKQVNDIHGHDIGDRVLQIMAQRLQASVRGGDTASRRGGDEFVILALDTDAPNAASLSARIGESVAQACHVDGVSLTVTASIGVALYPEDGSSAHELLKKADMAMYTVKRRTAALRTKSD
jgi:diguanylate cyclase (GGDEF)-like protein